MVPTPVVYYAAHKLDTGSAVAVTGSHNPPEYNGLKMVVAGVTLSGEEIQALRERIERGDFAQGEGRHIERDVSADYLDEIVGDVKVARPMSVIVDCGNGVAGALAPELYRRMGCKVHELYCEVDGTFPNHHPDPSQPENLQDVIRLLKESDAEIGLAFDGDGDRLGVVTKDGEVIYADRQRMLFARDVLQRSPGAQIIYDVKCTTHLAPWIRQRGGGPVLRRTGHSFIKAKLRETGAPRAGEMSGHIFFKARWYGFDAGLYAGARLLEILSKEADPSRRLNAPPDSTTTPALQLKTAEGENFTLVDKPRHDAEFERAAEVISV